MNLTRDEREMAKGLRRFLLRDPSIEAEMKAEARAEELRRLHRDDESMHDDHDTTDLNESANGFGDDAEFEI